MKRKLNAEKKEKDKIKENSKEKIEPNKSPRTISPQRAGSPKLEFQNNSQILLSLISSQKNKNRGKNKAIESLVSLDDTDFPVDLGLELIGDKLSSINETKSHLNIKNNESSSVYLLENIDIYSIPGNRYFTLKQTDLNLDVFKSVYGIEDTSIFCSKQFSHPHPSSSYSFPVPSLPSISFSSTLYSSSILSLAHILLLYQHIPFKHQNSSLHLIYSKVIFFFFNL
jgi:hypothetical protein